MQVLVVHGHTLWDTDELIKKAGGKAPGSMKAFTALTRKVGKPAEPQDALSKLPGGADGDVLQAEGIKALLAKGSGDVPGLKDLGLELPDGQETPFRVRGCLLRRAGCSYQRLSTREAASALTPHAGIEQAHMTRAREGGRGRVAHTQGGETEGLRRMKEQLSDTDFVCNFRKPKGNPTQFDPAPCTTVLSPYMKFGCLSARTFYHAIQDAYKKGGSHSEPPESLLAQVLCGLRRPAGLPCAPLLATTACSFDDQLLRASPSFPS